MNPIFMISILTLLTACAAGLTPSERAELATIEVDNVIPKSSATAFVWAFDHFCVSGPQTHDAREALLRDHSYVPTSGPDRAPARIFAVDSANPAVVLDDTGACSVLAVSRTGQTERLHDYIATRFPEAREMNPNVVSDTSEALWSIDAPRRALIGTFRTLNNQNLPEYRAAYVPLATNTAH